MRIRERSISDVAVVDLGGKLTLTDDPGLVKEVVSRLVSRGQHQIVLNLAEVNYIDSSGLGELVSCYLTAVRRGGTIKLATVRPRVMDLLVLTKLLTIFDAHSSEEAAIMSFAGAPV